jgi:hypothetical protein
LNGKWSEPTFHIGWPQIHGQIERKFAVKSIEVGFDSRVIAHRLSQHLEIAFN